MDKRINGRTIANAILEQLKPRVKKLKKKPCLAVFSAGDHPASAVYIHQKQKAAQKIGAKLKQFKFKKETSYQEFAEKLNQIVKDKKFSGVIIQKPLPVNLGHSSLDSIIPLKKDVDGLNPKSTFIPPVAKSVLRALDFIRIKKLGIRSLFLAGFPTQALINWLNHRFILVIGRGQTAGQPIAKAFSTQKIKFLIAHRETEELAHFTKRAKIIISCVGKKIITPAMLKKKVILIGVGIKRIKKEVYQGDFDEEEIKDLVSYYTPTPGGIGPLTVASLMENLIEATKQQSK